MSNIAIKAIKATLSSLSAHPRQKYISMATLATLPALAICALLTVASATADGGKGTAPEAMLVRHGEQIIVPEKSPFRNRLKVASVAMADIPHILNFPAAVEADSSRTVNVLPPLTGRLAEVKVKLGDTVKAGQLLAVISSGDLAQAYADAEKAKDALELARSALARGKGVNAAGANAAKDLEQLESSVVQTSAEMKRAETKLAALGVDTKTNDKSHTLKVLAPVAGTVTATGARTFNVCDLSFVLVSTPRAANFVSARFISADVCTTLLSNCSKSFAALAPAAFTPLPRANAERANSRASFAFSASA